MCCNHCYYLPCLKSSLLWIVHFTQHSCKLSVDSKVTRSQKPLCLIKSLIHTKYSEWDLSCLHHSHRSSGVLNCDGCFGFYCSACWSWFKHHPGVQLGFLLSHCLLHQKQANFLAVCKTLQVLTMSITHITEEM